MKPVFVGTSIDQSLAFKEVLNDNFNSKVNYRKQPSAFSRPFYSVP